MFLKGLFCAEIRRLAVWGVRVGKRCCLLGGGPEAYALSQLLARGRGNNHRLGGVPLLSRISG